MVGQVAEPVSRADAMRWSRSACQHVRLAVDDSCFLAFRRSHVPATPRWRRRNRPRPRRSPDSLGECPLWHQLNLNLAAEKLGTNSLLA